MKHFMINGGVPERKPSEEDLQLGFDFEQGLTINFDEVHEHDRIIDDRKSSPGRRGILNDQLIVDLCHAIRQGNYVKVACASCGISMNSFYGWMKKGEQPGCKPIYAKLVREVGMAESEIENKVVKCWVDKCPTDWQASRDFLARRFPQRWSNKERREITGADGGPIQSINVATNIDLSKLSDEELEALEKITAKLKPSEYGSDFTGEVSEETE